MANKKDLAAFAAQTLAVLKAVAESTKNADVIKQVAELEKQRDEVMTEMSTIGPCFGCKRTDTVKKKDLEYKEAQWFTCPHKDKFCPDCLKAGREEAKKKRDAAKEARKKEQAHKKSKK